MGITDKIISFEEGEMDEQEVIQLFQELVSTGVIDHFQGSYQRIAQMLIDEGSIEV